MKVKLFTHTDLDGIGCAVLAYLAFGQENVDIEYCDYKDVDAKVGEFASMALDRNYDNVFITDISVNEETAEYLMKAPEYLIQKCRLLDHHATALELNKYDWCNVKVVSRSTGIKTSGTKLFYQHLLFLGRFDKYDDFVCNNIRSFVEKVNDYDTWRWKEELGEEGIVCKQLNDLFHIYGRDKFIEWAFNNIKYILRLFPGFNDKDTALLEQKQKDIDIYIDKKNKQLTTIKDNFGYTCGVVFAEKYFSELGNRLSELHPELDYIAMVDISYGGVSYRTVRDDIDLGGEIAHSFGGGGHRKAAGSTFDASAIKDAVLHYIFDIDEIIA